MENEQTVEESVGEGLELEEETGTCEAPGLQEFLQSGRQTARELGGQLLSVRCISREREAVGADDQLRTERRLL